MYIYGQRPQSGLDGCCPLRGEMGEQQPTALLRYRGTRPSPYALPGEVIRSLWMCFMNRRGAVQDGSVGTFLTSELR